MSIRHYILLIVVTVSAVTTMAIKEKKAMESAAAHVQDKQNAQSTEKEERVWTFSQYEFGLLRDEQKSEFAVNTAKASVKNKILADIVDLKTKDDVLSVLKNRDKWEVIENKIKSVCDKKSESVDCKEIADLRLNVLMNYRARK